MEEFVLFIFLVLVVSCLAKTLKKKWRLWLPQGYKIIWLYHGTESMYRWWKGFVGVPWRKSMVTRINQFVSVFGETKKVYNQMRKKIIGCILVMSWKSGICPLPSLNLFTLYGGVLPSSHRRCGPWCRTKFEKIFPFKGEKNPRDHPTIYK